MSSRTTRVLYDLVARDHASRTFVHVGEAATSMERKTTAVGAAIGRGLAVGTVAVGALGVASVHMATQFQTSMTHISTQAGASKKDVKLLSDQVLKLGGKVQQAPEQLADSLYHLKSVGMDNVQAMKALREASDLAAVGGADLEQTTNALAGAWRTGIKGATSFHQAVSTVNAIIGAGNMTMEQFNAAIGTGILPSAKTFGLSLQQVGAALALMTDEGIDSASAATRLRMSFSLLGAPSGAAEKQLKKIGLTGLQLAEAMRGKDGLIGAIQLLKDHLDKSGMSASKQSQLLSRAFGGGRSSSGILLMINNLDVLKKKQDQVNHSAGKFDEAVKQQRATVEAQWKRLTTGLESMSVRLGTALLPPVADFIGYLNDKAIPTAERFGGKLLGIVPTAKLKSEFGQVEKVVGDFWAGLTGSSKSAKDLFGGLLDTSPHLGSGKTSAKPKGPALAPMPHYGVGQVAPANGQIADASKFAGPHGGSGLVAPLAKAKITPPKSLAQKLGETIRKAVSGGIESVDWGKMGASVGKGLGTAFQWIVSHGTELSKKLGVAIGKVDWVSVGKSLGVVAVPLSIGIVNTLFDPLFHKDFWEKHWLDTIIGVISVIPVGKAGGIGLKLGGRLGRPLLEGVGKGLDRIPWSRIIPFSEKLTESVGPVLRGVRGWVGRVAGGFADSFRSRFPRAAQAFEDQLILLPVRLGDLGRALKRKAGELIDGMGQSLIDHLPGSSNRFIRAAYRWFGRFTFWQVGVNLAQSLLSGIWSKAKDFGGWLKGHLVDPVINWVKSGFGIHSPSTVFIGIGGNIVAGLLAGILLGAKGIGGWISAHVIGPALAPFAGAGSWLYGKGSSTVSGFKLGAAAVARGIGGWFSSHVQSPTASAFRGAGSWLYGKGQAVTGGLFSGLKQPWGTVQKWVSGVAGWIKAHKGPISLDRQLLHPAGVALMKGLLSGLKVGFKDVGSFVYKVGDSVAGTVKSIASSLGFGGGGGSASRWSGLVASVLQMLGAPAYAQGAVLKRIQIESGGNPNAINLWDSNAKAGHPSQGLMQTIPSTFAAYAGPFKSRGITDPMASIYAGVNYAMHRYGSNWISVMTRPGGYAKGTGGAAPGWAWVGERGPELVKFGGGETVLPHQQSMAAAASAGIRLPGYVSGTISNAADRVRRDRQKVADAKDDLARAERRRKGVAAAEARLKAAKKELQAAEISLKNAKRSAKTSIANSIATGLQKTLATGTSSAIASAVKSLATKLLNAGYSGTAASIQRKGARLESLADKRAGVQAQIKAANQYASDQTSNIKDFLSISGTSATSVGDLISQMTGQQKTASNFVTLTKSLKARGASKDLIEQLSEAGPGSQLATILGNRSVTTQDIAKLNKLMSSGNKLATGFGKDMADLMYDSGKNAGKGFLTGLKSQEAALGKAMAKLATDLVKQIKKTLKIKSPSQVTRDEVGKQFALGMAVGIDRHRPHVAAAAQRMAATARKAASASTFVPVNGSRAGSDATWQRLAAAMEQQASQPQELTGQLVLDSGELLGVIRGTVKPLIKQSENNTAYRAKVGRR
ncbi:phage tail tape measure protein [Streptomyces atriruber]|uniref:Phage tail tape measure protein n=3 Tax=Streptomyces TaxID=1883 RepID=A0ABV3C0Z7_9ACTN